MLVTRVSDRKALTRLLRAALRHEVAQVTLTEAPRAGQHTLDLRLAGSPNVSVLAEPAGAPNNGLFPLRLRPLHRAQAAELFALIEDSPSSSEPKPSPRHSTVPPLTPSPDTIAGQRTIGFGDAGPIVRAMSGSAPPPTFNVDPRVTARLLPDDPRRTVPSARWRGEPPSQAKREAAPDTTESPPISRTVIEGLPDDPRRTVRSASWIPTPMPPSGPEADDPSLSVSVIFEPDAYHPSPADLDGPSLSVSVIFEPAPPTIETKNGALDPDLIVSEVDVESLDDDELDAIVKSIAPGPIDFEATQLETADTETPPDMAPHEQHGADMNDFFFDAALANLPMDLVEPSVITSAPLTPSMRTPLEGATPPPDDDDDFDTLIHVPGQTGAHRTIPVEAQDVEQPKKSASTGHGRKKKTTRQRPKTRGTDAPASRPEEENGASSRRSSRPGATDPLLGRKVGGGKYVIADLIGSGAAGAVYKATHRELRRTVAVKVLHPHYQQDPHFMKGFRGEALAASQIDHPNVMRVLDFGVEPDGLVYIVMEYLSGRTLQSLLDEERRLKTERAVEIMIQVCAALSVAHDNGIIHRDIKPDNIMLVPSRNDEGTTFELVKVCDFGIAALQNPAREDIDLVLNENIIAGTPEYMSPEQARGSEIDARSDVYAAGICLYELVTGRPPFLGNNAAEILIKQLEEAPRPPSQLLKGLDSIVEEIILRAIAKEPSKRQQSARELRVELKEIIDPTDAGGAAWEDELSIVENVPVLDDPGSGFPGFFIALSSSILRFGRFERGHPEASQAMKELLKATRAALRGRRELTFARRDSTKAVGFCVMTGHGELVDLRRLLGSQLFGSFGYPFIEALAKKGIASATLREGIPDTELQYIIEMLLGPHGNADLRKELMSKPLHHVSILFGADVVGRDRKLSWKVGLCAARLTRDLRALSMIRGISLKKMREFREDLVAGVAHVLTKGEEVKQLLFNGDLIDEPLANLRGFSGFHVAPLLLERLLHDPAVDAVKVLIADVDKGEIDSAILHEYLRAFALRLLNERSTESDRAVAELYRRGFINDDDVPRDLQEQIRAQSLAEALVRDPQQFLRALDFIQDPDDYGREITTLEAAMAVLARRAEAGALLAVIGMLARHAKGGGKAGPRENHALRAMKSMIDKQRLVPIANALLVGPPHQREAGRQLLVLAGSAGANALYVAREGVSDPNARPIFVSTFRETGPAGWSLLSAMLPRIEVHTDADVALVEDLLRAMPDRLDPALGEAVSKFLGHPRLRPMALSAIVPLWGDRARKPLLDALEFAEEPARVVAMGELRRLRAVDDGLVAIIERLLTMKGSASEELRAAAASALADVGPSNRVRAIGLLVRGVEGKRGLVAMLRGDGSSDESIFVTEAMARALFALDRTEAVRAVKSRMAKADPQLRARLTALLPPS